MVSERAEIVNNDNARTLIVLQREGAMRAFLTHARAAATFPEICVHRPSKLRCYCLIVLSTIEQDNLIRKRIVDYDCGQARI